MLERGGALEAVASHALADAGFDPIERDVNVRGHGLHVPLVASDTRGRRVPVELSGAYTVSQSGLARSDLLWRTIGRLAVLGTTGLGPALVVTTDLPPARSAGDRALRALGPDVLLDVVVPFDAGGTERLTRYASGDRGPLAGFWSEAEVARRSLF